MQNQLRSQTMCTIFACYICRREAINCQMCSSCCGFFCYQCLENYLKNNKSECPKCNQKIDMTKMITCQSIGPQIINELTSFLKRSKISDLLICDQHEIPKQYYCTNCNKSVCSDCSIIEQQHQNHKMIRLSQAKQAYTNKMEQILEKVKQRKSFLEFHKQQIKQRCFQANEQKNYCIYHLQKNQQNYQDKLIHKFQQQIYQFEKLFHQQVCSFQEKLQNHEVCLQKLKNSNQVNLLTKAGVEIEDFCQKNYEIYYQPYQYQVKQQLYDNYIVPRYKKYNFVFHNCSLLKKNQQIFSELVCDKKLIWKVKISPSRYNFDNTVEKKNLMLCITVELKRGYQQKIKYRHCFSIKNQLNRQKNISKQFPIEFKNGQRWSYDNFTDLRTLYEEGYVHPQKDYLEICLSVAPLSFYLAALNQQQTIKQKQKIISQQASMIQDIRQKLQRKNRISTRSSQNNLEDQRDLQCLGKVLSRTQSQDTFRDYEAAFDQLVNQQNSQQPHINIDLIKIFAKTKMHTTRN